METLIRILRNVDLPDAVLVDVDDCQPADVFRFKDERVMVPASSPLFEGEVWLVQVEEPKLALKYQRVRFLEGVTPDRFFALTEGEDFEFKSRR